MKIVTINPATEEVIAEHDIMSKEQVNERVKRAREAFNTWRLDPIGEHLYFMRLQVY